MCAKSLQSCQTLGDPMDCSPPGSSVYGILQAKILKWVGMPSSRGSSWPRDPTQVSYVSCTGRWVLYHWHLMESPFYHTATAKSLQSCPTLWPRRRQPTRLLRPWDSPGKNPGVGCHFLLQCVKVKSLSRVWLLATPWTAAYQAPPSLGFSRQEYWSGVPLPSPILS